MTKMRPGSLIAGGVCVAAALALAVGCGSTPGGTKSSFPRPEKLAELGPAPEVIDFYGADVDDVASWSLEGPFPSAVDVVPYAPRNDWEGVLQEAVSRRVGLALASEGMHCAAREVGRFLIERQARPSDRLTDFISARCGTGTAELRVRFFRGEVPEQLADEALLEQWRPSVEELVAGALQGGPVLAGLWFEREGQRSVVSVVSGTRRVHVEPSSSVVDDSGRIFIRGETLERVEEIEAWINQGPYGYAECERDPDLALPRFALTCQLAEEDRSARVEVYTREPGRLVGEIAVHTIARRPDAEASLYERASYAPPRVIVRSEELAGAAGELINEVREAAALPPLRLDAGQSTSVAEVAPHFFAALTGAEPEAVADLVILGVAAGWDVKDIIKSAHVTARWTSQSQDLSEWLSAALERPSGRAVLLNPEVGVLAVGGWVQEEPRAIAAMASTYELFGGEDYRQAAREVFERIAHERADRGLPPPERVDALQGFAYEAADHVLNAVSTPAESLQWLLDKSVQRMNRSCRGWTLEANPIEDLPLPEEILDGESLRIALAVTHYRPPAFPWGRYLVLLVVIPDDVRV